MKYLVSLVVLVVLGLASALPPEVYVVRAPSVLPTPEPVRHGRTVREVLGFPPVSVIKASVESCDENVCRRKREEK